MTSKHVMSRAVVALTLGTALAMSTAALAGAQGNGSWGNNSWGHRYASARVSPFAYANTGLGGVVTAASATSLTITEWNGTSATFALTSATTYTAGSTSVGNSALATGERVRVGVSSSDSTTATSVSIELAQLFGTVTGVSGNTITIKDPQGFTRTIVVSSSTTYPNSGLSAVTTGAKVFAQGTVDPNGTTLDAMTLYVGTAGQMSITWGTVTGFTTSSVTIESKGGTSTTYTYTTNTTIKALGRDNVALTSSDLANGEHIAVESNSTATTTAVSIYVQLANLSGVVTAVSGNNITIQDHESFTHLILVGSATTYSEQGATATVGLSAIVVGTHIRAEGLVDTNGTTLDALAITICSPTNQSNAKANDPGQGKSGFGGGFGGRHHHGHHGFGRGGGEGGF